MECNKDEAFRAKEIAERKFMEKNYTAAKKFALKAQNLHPELEGLIQVLTTIDVFISAENKIGGEADWYGILGVNPLDDDDTIRKQYRKLVLILHPDKNKSLGAEGAFKLVSEAWSLLSDKAKRLAYNQKRNSNEIHQKSQPQKGGPTAPSSANGYQNFTSSATSNARAQKNTWTGSTSVPPVKKSDTFWTICNRCKTHYEYLRVYLNNTLLCPHCHQAFIALEKGPPPNALKSSNLSSRQQSQKPKHHTAGSNLSNSERNYPGAPGYSYKTNSHGISFSKSSIAGTTFGPQCGSTQFSKTTQQASEKVKREREEGQSSADLDRSHLQRGTGNASLTEEMPWKKTKLEDKCLNGQRGFMANQTLGNGVPVMGSISDSRKGNSGIDVFRFTGMQHKPDSVRELSYTEMKNMLMDKARTEICRILKQWSSMTVGNAKNKQKNEEKGKIKKQKTSAIGDIDDMRYYESDVTDGKFVAGNYVDDMVKEVTLPLAITVPDPDFHNFDSDRTESCFGEDQVWATYDDDDGMPRYYARIQKVISLTPFKVRISWLNSKSNSELSPLDWIGSGFTKTCGDFRTGRQETATTLNAFSHKVRWIKGSRGVIQIYPRKGEVWALYKNWSSKWNQHTPNEVIHKYEMVEVLCDFEEEQGVCVATLIKVAGFKTVFRLQMHPKEVRRIIKEEMFRFSHQVPYYQLTGEEAHNAPNGCWELDPAAMPLELLQVTIEANDENGGKVEENVHPDASRCEVNTMLEAKKAEIVANCQQSQGVVDNA